MRVDLPSAPRPVAAAVAVALALAPLTANAQTAPPPAAETGPQPAPPSPPSAGTQLAPERITATPPSTPVAPGSMAVYVLSDPDDARAPLLAGTLRYHANQERLGRFVGAGAGAGAGAGLALAGVLQLVSPGLRGDPAAPIVASVYIGGGVAEAVLGVTVALIPGTYERMADGYEHDLRTMRPGAAYRRALARWTSEADRAHAAQVSLAVVNVAVGAGVMVLGAVDILDTVSAGSINALVLGPMLLALGGIDVAIGIGSAFIDPGIAATLRAFRLASGLEGPGTGPMVLPMPAPRPAPLPSVSLVPLPGGMAGSLSLRF